jgi:hypothetical protein
MHAMKLLSIIIALAVYGVSQQPSKTADTQDKPNTQQRDSKASTSALPFASPEKANYESNRSTQDRPESAGISPTTIGVGTLIVYSLQFVALVATWWLMMLNGRRQLRAYVTVKSGSLWEGTTLTPPQPARTNVPGAALWIENGGQTPAYKVRSWINIAVIFKRDENNGALNVPRIPEEYSNTLGPGVGFSKSIWFDRPLAANEITDIAAGARAIYVYGRVEYRDAFGKKRFTDFRLHYNGQFPPVPDAILFFGERGNDAD